MITLRKDGTWTIYQVEAWLIEYPEDSTNQYARNQYARWFIPNLARVTSGYPWSNTKLEDRPRCIRENGANGKCWQQTGNDGFLDQEIAQELLFFCIRYGRGYHRFRLVERTITQSTTVLLTTPADGKA